MYLSIRHSIIRNTLSTTDNTILLNGNIYVWCTDQINAKTMLENHVFTRLQGIIAVEHGVLFVCVENETVEISSDFNGI